MLIVSVTRRLWLLTLGALHMLLCPKDRIAAGITEEMLRLSVGTEDVEDLIYDIDQALGSIPNPKLLRKMQKVLSTTYLTLRQFRKRRIRRKKQMAWLANQTNWLLLQTHYR